VSPRTSNRADGSRHSNNSSSPGHGSPLQKEVPQSESHSTPNLNPPIGAGDMKGEKTNGHGQAAKPASLGGRTTAESQPVHEISTGFREGGQRGITSIGEEVE
jgi:hypothetical protein